MKSILRYKSEPRADSICTVNPFKRFVISDKSRKSSFVMTTGYISPFLMRMEPRASLIMSVIRQESTRVRTSLPSESVTIDTVTR